MLGVGTRVRPDDPSTAAADRNGPFWAQRHYVLLSPGGHSPRVGILSLWPAEEAKVRRLGLDGKNLEAQAELLLANVTFLVPRLGPVAGPNHHHRQQRLLGAAAYGLAELPSEKRWLPPNRPLDCRGGRGNALAVLDDGALPSAGLSPVMRVCARINEVVLRWLRSRADGARWPADPATGGALLMGPLLFVLFGAPYATVYGAMHELRRHACLVGWLQREKAPFFGRRFEEVRASLAEVTRIDALWVQGGSTTGTPVDAARQQALDACWRLTSTAEAAQREDVTQPPTPYRVAAPLRHPPR